jgi:hypothetical protein
MSNGGRVAASPLLMIMVRTRRAVTECDADGRSAKHYQPPPCSVVCGIRGR